MNEVTAPTAKPTEAEAGGPAPLRPRGSNHVGMRQFNERVVLQAIRLNGSLPKAEVARVTGLTAQTIGLITTRLEEDGLLLRQAPVRGRIGQPSVPLALNPDGAFSIGIKVGRRSADWLLVDFTGRVRQRESISYLFPDAETLLPTLAQRMAQMIDGLGALAPRLVGVGVATPLRLGGWHRMLGLSTGQSERWNAVNLGAALQQHAPVPVSVAKDTSAACVAELVAGRGKDLKSFLYVFVDTFVGGGLVINSQPHWGLHGNAGAVASLPLGLADPQQTEVQTPSSAGLRGLPEQLVTRASLWELEQRFVAAGLEASAAYDARALSAPFAAATEEWLANAATALAHCAVSSSALLDIEAVVIDGSLHGPLLQRLIDRTRQAMDLYDWEGLWRTPVVEGSIGSDARALGGALLPLHANFAPDRDLFLKVAV